MKKHFCSFCGKESEEVAFLIAGPQVAICNECVALCQEIISTHRKEANMPTPEVHEIHEISLMAATEFARAHTSHESDPIKFGHDVALAHCACSKTLANAGDEKVTAAALAALSIPLEVLQCLERVSSLMAPPTHLPDGQTNSVGV